MTPGELKRLRKSLGLTQAQAADATEYSRQQIVKLEGGKHAIRRPESVQRALVEYMRKGKMMASDEMTSDEKRRVWMQNYGPDYVLDAIGEETTRHDLECMIRHMICAENAETSLTRLASHQRIGEMLRGAVLPYLDSVYDEVAGGD